ncbi:Flp pilus assembly protein, protease CpaA [Jannaschia seosinensis]|uniref:Flp pilus assembly protein, protease CpaA n=1 Tax=Jannaschia seosinensis TaxID=313367 RepID=A0A0M7B6C2_9RHOB|nr:prepilin peptidase [Jannaschia seosinensis]CUH08274.1 Flp pilus assembly protein, protease CpaA [Jannaschia seosinensis]
MEPMATMDFALTAYQGLVFGLLTLPICLWAAWTDIKEMKIRNNVVLALVVVYVVAGIVLFPFADWLWGFAGFAVVLVIGFVLSGTMGLGAGDAKFAAAMAPFVPLADVVQVAYLYVAWSVLLIAGMAIVRRQNALRVAAPDWIWFQEDLRRHVPLGVGLAPTLSSYFFAAALAG